MNARFYVERAGTETRRQVIALHVEFRILGSKSCIGVELRRWGGSGARWCWALRLHDDLRKHFLSAREAG